MGKIDFFVSTAEESISTGELTATGKAQAEAAGSALQQQSKLLGGAAVILSLGDAGAAETATIIAAHLDLPEKHVVHTDNIPARNPYAIPHLDRILEDVVTLEGLDPDTASLVVVSPLPLVEAVRKTNPDEASEARAEGRV